MYSITGIQKCNKYNINMKCASAKVSGRKMTRKWEDKSGVKGQEHLNIGENAKAIQKKRTQNHVLERETENDGQTVRDRGMNSLKDAQGGTRVTEKIGK